MCATHIRSIVMCFSFFFLYSLRHSGSLQHQQKLRSAMKFRAECKLVARTTKQRSVAALTLEPKLSLGLSLSLFLCVYLSVCLKRHHKNYAHIASIGMFGFLLRVCYYYSLLCRYSCVCCLVGFTPIVHVVVCMCARLCMCVLVHSLICRPVCLCVKRIGIYSSVYVRKGKFMLANNCVNLPCLWRTNTQFF